MTGKQQLDFRSIHGSLTQVSTNERTGFIKTEQSQGRKKSKLASL